MNKFFVIVLLFFSFAYSENLLITKDNQRFCVVSYVGSKYTLYVEGNAYLKTNYSISSSQIVSLTNDNSYYFDTTTLKCKLNPTPVEPEPTNPDNGGENGSNPINPITPDENGLIMGMKETDFHFSMAIWGIALGFLMSIGLIISF
ncbi:hypothetical protein ACOL3A_01170 [Aliarcobacter butzleri]